MTLTIRPVVARDWPVLFDLWVEAWTAFLPGIDFQARLPWFPDYMAQLQADGAEVLCAVSVDGPIGFVSIDAAKQDMDQLVTAPKAQRQGVGRLLVRAAKARSPAGVGLKVLQINRIAIALYRDEGFDIVGEGVSESSGLANFSMRWPGSGASAN